MLVKRSPLIFLICITLCLLILTCSAATQPSKQCSEFYNCALCLRNPKCGWCSRTKGSPKNKIAASCMESELVVEHCEDGFDEIAKSVFTVDKDSPMKESLTGESVQMQPQQVSLAVHPGTKYTIEFKFKKATDYPVDIYYLMDFSKSMANLKNQLAKLGQKLATAMGKMTRNFRLGFGSFIDKVAMPFTDTRPEYLKSPCKDDICATPYSFKNHLPLSDDFNAFSNVINSSKISVNDDSLEGQLDALMQAMVCSKQINWRDQSRKIIVLFTDAHFHIAGDGKLAGIIQPNDGRCHLDASGIEYTHGTIMDYPSISQIKFMAEALNMNLIFGVTKDQLKRYTKLKNAINGAVVGELKGEEDIINLVINNYKNMSLSLELTDNAPDSVKIEYRAKCNPDVWTNSASCSDLKQGQEIEFKADIKVKDCSEPEQTIIIKPTGMADSLIINLKVICNCQCENFTHPTFEPNSKSCSGVGNLTCGRCSCSRDYEGKICECKKRDGRMKSTGASGCLRNDVVCSNRGSCECGQCVCMKYDSPNKVVSGDFCECDNFSCPGTSGDCSGHGTCDCGVCTCESGWGGSDCQCSLDRNTCLEPENSESLECSGRGECKCGRCECKSKEELKNTYKGDYCERCIDCQIECSPEMHICIDCLVHKVETDPQKCVKCRKVFKNFTTAPDVSEMLNVSDSSTLCQPLTTDEQGCTFKYIAYHYGDELWALADALKTCPETVNIAVISASVVGSTLLAGIILLVIWKVITTVHDNREFEKFEKQRNETNWGRGENPLFRQAVTTHINPAFTATEEKTEFNKNI